MFCVSCRLADPLALIVKEYSTTLTWETGKEIVRQAIDVSPPFEHEGFILSNGGSAEVSSTLKLSIGHDGSSTAKRESSIR